MTMDMKDKTSEAVDMEKELTSEIDMTNENELTSEYLKKTTTIKTRSWLSFFLFQVFVGGLISLIYPIVTFKLEDYGGSYILAMSDISIGILSFILAIQTLKAFSNRKRNAVFLGVSYMIICVVSNLLIVFSGSHEQTGMDGAPSIMRSLIWSGIWLVYLHQSDKVEEVIPSDYRRVSRRDYIFIGAVVAIPIIFFIGGLFDANRIQSEKTERIIQKYKDSHRLFSNDIKYSLASNQRTDGRIIFSIPKGFNCKDSIVNGSKVFYLSREHIADILICSSFDADDSNENISSIYKSWNDNEMSQYKSSVIENSKVYEKNITKCVVAKKYMINGDPIFWRLVLMFDKETDKACLISSYDGGYDKYLNPLLESIRFKR